MNSETLHLSSALISFILGSSLVLRADTPPQIIDSPFTQFAWVGRPVTLKVSFTNMPPMAFQWRWNGADLTGATNGNLRLASAQLTNSGDYRVILSNSAGIVTSAVARLTVRGWPQPTGVNFTNLSNLERNLQSVLRTHAVPAASLAIMKDGRLILARGYGYADPENSDEPAQPDSLFHIASLSKAITATAVLKLVDDGRLNLDDPIFPMLHLPSPSFPGAQMDPRLTNITVRQCLNHTAGWDRDTAKNPSGGIGFNQNTWLDHCAKDLGLNRPLTARDMVGWITGFPLQHNPGTTFAYSNAGYWVAGLLIEELTGRSYEEAVLAMLSPADITRLRFPGATLAERRPDEVVQWLSPIFDLRSLTFNEPLATVTSDLAYRIPPLVNFSAGGWATCALDYARLVDAIDGRPSPPDLLTTNAVKTMLTVTPQSRAAGDPYGMGWHIDESTGEIDHGALLYGSGHGRVVRRRDGVTYVAFCSTYDDGLVDELKATLDAGVSAIKTWPTNDLYAATMSYEAWQTHHFIPAELSQPQISGDNSDPDGDGISNLIEYAQGSDPRAADQDQWLRGRLVTNGNQSRFAIEYRRRPLGHAVDYAVDISSDLKTWQPFNGTTIEQLDADGMLNVSLLDSTPIVGSTPRFYRVSVKSLR